MESGFDIFNIMLQSMKPDNSFCPLGHLSQRENPLPGILTPYIIAYFEKISIFISRTPQNTGKTQKTPPLKEGRSKNISQLPCG
jgi:hypothetical protein